MSSGHKIYQRWKMVAQFTKEDVLSLYVVTNETIILLEFVIEPA